MFKFISAITLTVLAAVPLSAASCTSATSNLVANCGFETGSFANWSLSGYDAGAGYYGIDYGVDTADAHSGTYGAYLGGLGGILDLNQSLITTPGTTYNITFWLAQSPAAVAPYLNSFSAMFGSSTLVSLAAVPNLAFTQYSFNAIASSSATTLTFGFRDDIGFFSIDDITATAVVTPEPATLPLLPVAFVLILLWRRRLVQA